MILNVVVEDQVYPVTVPDAIVAEGEAFFSKIDSDMDKGWQMSRDWVDSPSLEQRCQIAVEFYGVKNGRRASKPRKLATVPALCIAEAVYQLERARVEP